MQRGARAVQHFNRVHGIERNGQVQIVMRGLAVVDAKAIQQHQGLLEGSSAQDQIRLPAARAALSRKTDASWRSKSCGDSSERALVSTGSTSTAEGDSARGTGTGEPRTTMVSEG